MLAFSSNVKQITDFVNNVASTGGGDLPEAYELVLRDAQKLNWRLRAAKALVMVRSMPCIPPLAIRHYLNLLDHLPRSAMCPTV